ncbi:MAG: hypothetical protein ACEPOW_06010 [Bacteroidales bacterium]
MKKYLIILWLCIGSLAVDAQIEDVDLKKVNDPHATQELYARTKQVIQFFRRFNSEEDQFGKGYKKSDKKYHNNSLRRKTLGLLFDQQGFVSEDLQKQFIKQITNPKKPLYLDFHGKDWFAEVSGKFLWKGQDRNIIMFLKLEKSNKGYKWVLTNVFFEEFRDMFDTSSKDNQFFLHPMSHELDFMTLSKAFRNIDNVQDYASDKHHIDYLSLFFYEMKLGNLVFQGVNQVKFHFFQIPDWYFELSYVNRPGFNAGWLITNLHYVTKEQKEALIKLYQP